MLAAGIDVISTVNIQHLESLNDVDLRGDRRARARDVPRPGAGRRRRGGAGRPHARGAARTDPGRQGVPGGSRGHRPLELLPAENLSRCASWPCARWPRTWTRGARRRDRPAGRQAVAERMLVLVEPRPTSQRLLRRAWRSAPPAGRRHRRAVGAPARPQADRGRGARAGRAAPAGVPARRPLPGGGVPHLVAAVARVVDGSRHDLRATGHARGDAGSRSCAGRW